MITSEHTGRSHPTTAQELLRPEDLAGIARHGGDLFGGQFLRERRHGPFAVGDEGDLVVDVGVFHADDTRQLRPVPTAATCAMTTRTVLRIDLLAFNQNRIVRGCCGGRTTSRTRSNDRDACNQRQTSSEYSGGTHEEDATSTSSRIYVQQPPRNAEYLHGGIQSASQTTPHSVRLHHGRSCATHLPRTHRLGFFRLST